MRRLQRQTWLAAVLGLMASGASLRLAAADSAPVASLAAPAAAAAATTTTQTDAAETVHAGFSLEDILGDRTRMIQVGAVVVIVAIYILVRK